MVAASNPGHRFARSIQAIARAIRLTQGGAMKFTLCSLIVLLAGCAASGEKADADSALMSLLSLEAPKKLSAEEQRRIAQSPLGSKENPVRASGVEGQYRYLARL